MKAITGNFSKRFFKMAGILFSVSFAVFFLMASPAFAAEESYVSGENITVNLLLDVNNNVPALVQVMVYNPENRLVGNSTYDFNLVAGKNELNLTVPFRTDMEGLHYLRYDIFANLAGASTLIVSSTRYFDGEFNDPPSIKLLAPEKGGVYFSGVPVEFRANVTDPEAQDITVTWISDLAGPIGTGPSFSKVLGAGVHDITIKAEDVLGKSRTLSFSITVVQSGSVRVEIGPGETKTIPLALLDPAALRPTLKLPGNLSLKVNASEIPAPASGTVGPVIDFKANASFSATPVKITLWYNASLVPDPTKLKLAWYDKGTGKWVLVENSIVDTSAHTVSGYVTHFTPFAPIIVDSVTNNGNNGGNNGGSGGSSGGGGGGGSPELPGNVRIKELSQTFVSSGQHAVFNFPRNVTCVLSIEFDSKKSFGKMTTFVEMLKGQSTLVSSLPPGLVYEHVNLWVGNTGMATPENIENPVIKFKVEKTWFEETGLTPSIIKMWRYDGNLWNLLPTRNTGEDNVFAYFEVETPGFSPFIITATTEEEIQAGENKESIVILPEKSETSGDGISEEIEKPEGENDEKTGLPGFGSILSGALIVTAYIVLRRKG